MVEEVRLSRLAHVQERVEEVVEQQQRSLHLNAAEVVEEARPRIQTL